ncbi:MAG: hypothetical protein MI810_14360 [Flavobacteriales bacterium]|nr:hypothetical protein [Flavobacteriales bacterium]
MKNGKKLDHIRFEYDQNSNINYGYTFPLKTIAVYSNGKEKDITSKSSLEVQCSGAKYSNGKISINAYPTQFDTNVIHLSAKYTQKEQVFEHKIDIPFNYLGQLKLNLSGNRGAKGTDGADGKTAILFRDGKDGEIGAVGQNGENGHDLSVYIWKDETSGLLRMKVEDLSDPKSYYYQYKNTGGGVLFTVNGGTGGKGGAGGEGGDGKDGRKTEKKIKSPGDGGNGGQGGDGGTGGNGGSVYVFIHPSAAEMERKISVYSFGGQGGEGGTAGAAGKAGDPLEGQEAAEDGTVGIPGSTGVPGQAGEIFEIVIEEFDIDS